MHSRRFRVPHPGQIDLTTRIIRQTKHIRREHRELLDDLRRVGRRQQAHLPSHQACREPDRKSISIGADVQNVVTRRQSGGHARDICQEVPRENGRTQAVRDHCIEVSMGDERKRRTQAPTLSCAR